MLETLFPFKNRDPLDNLVPDVFELIFQHLSWDEIILSSEVNSNWCRTIGDSHCMNKVKINIQMFSQLAKHNDLHTILRHSDNSIISKRRYRNIYLDVAHQIKDEALRKFLSSKSRKWKNVELLHADFDDYLFLKEFHETIESLSLSGINYCGVNSRMKETSFPRLKSLKIFSCSRPLIEAFEECSTLDRLQISELKNRDSSSGKLLVMNTKLETLIVLVNSYSTYFRKQIVVNIRFQLKKIVVDCWKDSLSEGDRECLKCLLKSQAESLRIVDINPWSGLDVLSTCFTFPNLTDFTFNVKNCDENIDWRLINFDRNQSINRVHVRSASKQESVAFYDAVFTAAPNLKIYKAKFMHNNDLSSLSRLCENLEELYIEIFNVQFLSNENCFHKLKCFNSLEINDRLLKTLQGKNKRNTFEELIVKL